MWAYNSSNFTNGDIFCFCNGYGHANREQLPFRTPGSVPPILGLACAPIVETTFLELAMSLLDFSLQMPLGTFSILLNKNTIIHVPAQCNFRLVIQWHVTLKLYVALYSINKKKLYIETITWLEFSWNCFDRFQFANRRHSPGTWSHFGMIPSGSDGNLLDFTWQCPLDFEIG